MWDGSIVPFKTMNAAGFYLHLLLLALFILTSILNANFLALTISDKQGVLKLMVGQCALYHLPSYLQQLALSILTCRPNIDFLFGQMQTIKKYELGHCSPANPK